MKRKVFKLQHKIRHQLDVYWLIIFRRSSNPAPQVQSQATDYRTVICYLSLLLLKENDNWNKTFHFDEAKKFESFSLQVRNFSLSGGDKKSRGQHFFKNLVGPDEEEQLPLPRVNHCGSWSYKQTWAAKHKVSTLAFQSAARVRFLAFPRIFLKMLLRFIDSTA